jgi:hypothetical protein
MKGALLFCGTVGLIAVVALFDPLMPHQAQDAFTVALILLMVADFVALIGVLLAGFAEGLPLGRHSLRPEDITTFDRIAFFTFLALILASAVVTSEAVPLMALLFSWLVAWSALRVLNHRRAVDRLASAPAGHLPPPLPGTSN